MQIVRHSLACIAIKLPNPLSEESTATCTITRRFSAVWFLILRESVPTATTGTITNFYSNSRVAICDPRSQVRNRYILHKRCLSSLIRDDRHLSE